MSRYAISDIHGHARTFGALLDRLHFSTADELFLLGDYIDRGPDSRGVIDKILALRAAGYRVNCLRGNHEAMLNAALRDPAERPLWLHNGGGATVDSYTAAGYRYPPPAHLSFVDALPRYLETEGYLLVHAGLRFGGPDPLTDTEALLWLRDWYADIDYAWLGERTVVHGHTKMSQARIEAQVSRLTLDRVLDIDNGCYSERAGMGQLCAFNLDTRELVFQARL